jgi:hypothetical protein
VTAGLSAVGGRSDRDGPVGGGGALKTTLRHTVRTVRFASARPTSAFRPLPDFLVIGAQRSGTTSLYRYLTRHPAVAPVLFGKGVHYFDMNFGRGLDWYRSHFPTSAYRSYLRRRTGVEPVTGEGSPYYLFHPLVPERVGDVLPLVRVIAMLRDPVQRAYSHYNHERDRGFEDLSFEDALRAEAERLAGEEECLRADPLAVRYEHLHHAYQARGMYLQQLRRWRDHVPEDRTLVIVSEEFFADPDGVYRTALGFLGLPDRSLGGYERANSRPSEKMTAVARSMLEERFAGPNHDLSVFLGRELPWSRT